MPSHDQTLKAPQPSLRDLGSELLLDQSEALFQIKDIMSRRVLTAHSGALLADIAEDMTVHNVSCAVVREQEAVVGIISEHDFLRAVAGDCAELYQLQASDIMSSPVQTVETQQTILQAGQVMEAHGIRRLPVINQGRLVGIITQTDLIRALTSVGAHHTVASIMSTDVITVCTGNTVAQASAVMDSQCVSCVIVEREDLPVGIVSERDVLRKVTGLRQDPHQLVVDDIMSSPMVSIERSYSIFSAARLLDQKHIHRLVVMEGDRLCGIVTQADIFRATKQELYDHEQARIKRLDESSSKVFMLDDQCRTTYCNPAFMRFLAVDDPDELIHRPLLPERFWINPEERPCFIEGLRQGVTQMEELGLKTSQGDEVFVNVFCMFTEDGLASQGILHDITARRKAEQALACALKETETANCDLKAMQSQLVQNEKLASIGQLAAGVAHEMNTPVGFVASNFETLVTYVDKFRTMLSVYDEFIARVASSAHSEFSESIHQLRETQQALKLGFVLEDIKDLFNESQEGLKRVTSIVQNLRDFSRIDQEKKQDDYNINDCIKSTLIVARNEIKYDADVETDLGEIPLVPCHSGQVNQVLLNILVNAAQAIKGQTGRQGKGSIRIKTYAKPEQVVCEITDNGPGIPPDKLPRIFDPFFTTKPAGKGTGLGLSVSHDIIANKHKGRLHVNSTVGRGTTFTIELPIRTEENGRQETTAERERT